MIGPRDQAWSPLIPEKVLAPERCLGSQSFIRLSSAGATQYLWLLLSVFLHFAEAVLLSRVLLLDMSADSFWS